MEIYNGRACPIQLKQGSRFIDLDDTPDSYADQTGKVLVVEDGKIIFIAQDAIEGGVTFLGLPDTPVSYVDQDGKILVVEDGKLVFADAPSGGLDRIIDPTLAVGGITEDMHFDIDTPFSVLWEQLLAPYIPSALTSLYLTPGSTVEVGTSVTITSVTPNWVADSAGDAPYLATITGAGFSGVYALITSGTAIAAASGTIVSRSTRGSLSWTINAKDKNDVALASKADYLSWVSRTYYGTSGLEALTESEAKGMNSLLSNATAGTYAFPAAIGEYKWFCVPSTEPQPNTFKDAATNLEIPFNSSINTAITNAAGLAITLKCYKSLQKLGGSINIKIT